LFDLLKLKVIVLVIWRKPIKSIRDYLVPEAKLFTQGLSAGTRAVRCWFVDVVLGIDDGNIPVWKYLDNDVMANQLLLRKPSIRRRVPEHRLWVDSGGYQIMVKGLHISVDDISRIYGELTAKCFLSLDYPVSDPTHATPEVIERNKSNFLKLIKDNPDKEIIPVVHLYPAKYLLDVTAFYRSLGIHTIAYGGIVPPLLRRTKLRMKSLIGFLILRKAFPNLRIHVLGAGSFLMIKILRTLGADSADTSTWRVKAAFGHVIVPGRGERYVGVRKIRFHTPRITDEELEILEKELRVTGFPLIHKLDELLTSFKGRALINAWIIAKGNGGISKRSPFRKLLMKLRDLMKEPLERVILAYEEG